MQYDEKLVRLFNNTPVDFFHPSNDRCLGPLLLEERMELATLCNPIYKAKAVTEEQKL